MHKNFYPRPPRGGRQQFPLFWLILLLFLSTPSARRATYIGTAEPSKSRNFYPRPPRGGRLGGVPAKAYFRVISIHALREEGDPYLPPSSLMHCAISIHALREEGDLWCAPCSQTPGGISIHALREEGDPPQLPPQPPQKAFLSTPSARRATMSGQGSFVPTDDFYPRPPRGGRPATALHCSCGI